MRNHRGFTLIELMIVLVIMLTVSAGIYKLLITTQRLSRAQAERVDLQSNVRTASLVVPSELKELNTVVGGTAAQNDILDAQPTSIQYRAMRGLGFVCAGTTTGQLRLSNYTGFSLRAPDAARDWAYVFVDNNVDVGSDDAWTQVQINGVVANNTCAVGVPATTVNITPALGSVPPIGTPVRVYEVMKLSLYASGGKSWLGAQGANDLAPQPLLGPLEDGDGLALTYLDAAGNPAAQKSDIKSVVLKVRGVTTQLVSTGGGNATTARVVDSLMTQVSLRNALR